MTSRLLLVRHGVTDWNRQGRFQGHADPPLSEDGLAEARLLAERLTGDASLRPARILTSTLARAHETASAIADAWSGDEAPALLTDARLMEVGQGEWEGRTHAQLEVEDAARYRRWRTEGGRQEPPGGEPLGAVLDRVASVVASLDDGGAWPVCVVSHGGTLRLMARLLLDLSPERAWGLDLDNASLGVLERRGADEPWRLVQWNDTHHLLGRVTVHVDEAEGAPLAL